jgi:hypothetical protein
MEEVAPEPLVEVYVPMVGTYTASAKAVDVAAAAFIKMGLQQVREAAFNLTGERWILTSPPLSSKIEYIIMIAARIS